MSRPEVVIEVSSNPRLAQDLAAGGVFVPGCSFKLNSECELVVRGSSGELRLVARVVYSDQVRGTGFELLQLDEETREHLGAVIGAPIELPMRRPPSSPPMTPPRTSTANLPRSSTANLPRTSTANLPRTSTANLPRTSTANRSHAPTPPAGRRTVTTPPAAVPVAMPVLTELPDAPVVGAAGIPTSSSPAIVVGAVEEVQPHRFDALDLEPERTEPISLEEPEEEQELELEPVDAAGADQEPSEELAPDVEAAINQASGGSDAKFARNIHERLRGLTLIQQIKLAHNGRDSERILLERMYGKNVWEALLRNPRLTGPEVARIARMGALPRPLIELICGNGGWLQIPEVRRALLSNPRLGTDQITKVLRLTPKHELRIVPQQTVYPSAVRETARRLLRTQD